MFEVGPYMMKRGAADLQCTDNECLHTELTLE
jgi:hypothetical protein